MKEDGVARYVEPSMCNVRAFPLVQEVAIRNARLDPFLMSALQPLPIRASSKRSADYSSALPAKQPKRSLPCLLMVWLWCRRRFSSAPRKFSFLQLRGSKKRAPLVAVPSEL
eukprot:1780870-Amphidinium_carterae.1